MTVPAVNVRGMAYDIARALVRAARAKNCGAFIFELARSEMGYTEQTCDEFATVVTAASIREGLRRPDLHPGRPLPGERQAVQGRSREGDRRACAS